MSKINGTLLREDMVAQGYNCRTLSEATKLPQYDPSRKGVCKDTVQRATSRKQSVHKLEDSSLQLICKVLNQLPSKYKDVENERVQPWYPPNYTPHRSREVYRAYQAIIRAIDSNRCIDTVDGTDSFKIPRECWEFFTGNGRCFKQFVLQNKKAFSGNGKISEEHWKSAFVDLRRRHIVIQLGEPKEQYRISSAKPNEMLEILAERTTIEVNAAKRACALPRLERQLISAEMREVLDACEENFKKDYPDKYLIEVEGQFHLCWAGHRSAQRRLLSHVIEVCKQIGDRMLWIDEDNHIQCRDESYPTEFRGMVDELWAMKEAFDKPIPDASRIEGLIRKHVSRSERITKENKAWVNQPWSEAQSIEMR